MSAAFSFLGHEIINTGSYCVSWLQKYFACFSLPADSFVFDPAGHGEEEQPPEDGPLSPAPA
jgi:hypothetical protein